jgi:hypothetical protein
VATEADVEQLFESLRPRIAEIQGRDAGLRTGGNVGCLLMVLPFVAAAGILLTLDEPRVSQALQGWPLLAALVIGVLVFVVGYGMRRPWATVSVAQREEVDRVLLQPLAALLLPGATFIRAPIMISRYHPSLLMPLPEGVRSTSCGRIEGRLLGRAVVIDELLMSGHMGARWVVCIDLPFALAGHVRIHRRTKLDPGRFWREGFEPVEEGDRRIGGGAHVEVGPLGIGSDEGLAAPAGAVPPDVVLTDGLFGVLRGRPDVWVAAAGRTLWIVFERSIHAFDSRVPGGDDVLRWRKAAVAMQDVEAVTREVLAAAKVRG